MVVGGTGQSNGGRQPGRWGSWLGASRHRGGGVWFSGQKGECSPESGCPRRRWSGGQARRRQGSLEVDGGYWRAVEGWCIGGDLVVVAAGLEEGQRCPAMSSEVPGAREPFDAVAQHSAAPRWCSGWLAAWDSGWSSGVPAPAESRRRRLPAAQPWWAWRRLVVPVEQACSGASSSTAKQAAMAWRWAAAATQPAAAAASK
jgi:hypothetical protein